MAVAALSSALIFCSALTFAAQVRVEKCVFCADWNRPHAPFKIFGNTYYVGTASITSILVTSQEGHILIDAANQESPPLILTNIAALGFAAKDIRLILITHDHYDHAGGVAEIQRVSGAVVRASPISAEVLRTGKPARGDPQADTIERFPVVANVGALQDGEVLRVGPLALTARFTPGHTPGGTSWSWESCEDSRCLNIAYLDSLAAVSSPGFEFGNSKSNPDVLNDFRRSFDVVSQMPCDIAISAHPEFSDFWKRLERRVQGDADALIDPEGCRRYAEKGRVGLDKRLTFEKWKDPAR